MSSVLVPMSRIKKESSRVSQKAVISALCLTVSYYWINSQIIYESRKELVEHFKNLLVQFARSWLPKVSNLLNLQRLWHTIALQVFATSAPGLMLLDWVTDSWSRSSGSVSSSQFFKQLNKVKLTSFLGSCVPHHSCVCSARKSCVCSAFVVLSGVALKPLKRLAGNKTEYLTNNHISAIISNHLGLPLSALARLFPCTAQWLPCTCCPKKDSEPISSFKAMRALWRGILVVRRLRRVWRRPMTAQVASCHSGGPILPESTASRAQPHPLPTSRFSGLTVRVTDRARAMLWRTWTPLVSQPAWQRLTGSPAASPGHVRSYLPPYVSALFTL